MADPDLQASDPDPDSGPRRYPSTTGGALYLLVVLGVCVGLAIVSLGDWRIGVRWIGGSLLAAAGFRLLVPGSQAGMLAVRHRIADTVLLAALGAAVIFLAGDIPNQPF